MKALCPVCKRYIVACSCPKKEDDEFIKAVMEHADETMNFKLYDEYRNRLNNTERKE